MKKSGHMVNKSFFRKLFFFLLLPCLAYTKGKVPWKQIKPTVEPPWLTGPLIAPSAHVVPLGQVNLEPYIFATAHTGTYGSDWKVMEAHTFWNNYFQVFLEVGLTPWMDFFIYPTVYWSDSQHQTAWTLGDMPFGFDFQLYHAPQDSWVPTLKFFVKENLPIGKYRNLNPKKQATDDGGAGTWSTGAGIVLGNLYHFTRVYYFSYRLYLTYVIPAPVRLTGFNYYGGGYGTNVRFFPPQSFTADFAFEITLAQTWAFAMDMIGYWGTRGRFTGKQGVNLDGTPARIGKGSQAQFSLAPAIEYNWSAHIGLIAGAWFTVAGRQAIAFSSGVIAFSYYK